MLRHKLLFSLNCTKWKDDLWVSIMICDFVCVSLVQYNNKQYRFINLHITQVWSVLYKDIISVALRHYLKLKKVKEAHKCTQTQVNFMLVYFYLVYSSLPLLRDQIKYLIILQAGLSHHVILAGVLSLSHTHVFFKYLGDFSTVLLKRK